MPVDLERKIGKVGNSLRVVIPQEIVNKLDLKEGDILMINTDDHRIIMKKKIKWATQLKKIEYNIDNSTIITNPEYIKFFQFKNRQKVKCEIVVAQNQTNSKEVIIYTNCQRRSDIKLDLKMDILKKDFPEAESHRLVYVNNPAEIPKRLESPRSEK